MNSKKVAIIGSLVASVYGKIKKSITQNNEEWIVIHHSIDSNVQLYKLQNILKRNGIKTKIDMDDKPFANALKHKSDTVLKLLVLEKDFSKAKQILDDNK
jgi:histidyl-tRNA synthetase